MATLELELWNIFTYYSLHGNPRDPSRIPETQFLKLCRDSSVMDPSMTDVALDQANLHLIWTSAITMRGNVLITILYDIFGQIFIILFYVVDIKIVTVRQNGL
jgi:hypothetical protein